MVWYFKGDKDKSDRDGKANVWLKKMLAGSFRDTGHRVVLIFKSFSTLYLNHILCRYP